MRNQRLPQQAEIEVAIGQKRESWHFKNRKNDGKRSDKKIAKTKAKTETETDSI